MEVQTPAAYAQIKKLHRPCTDKERKERQALKEAFFGRDGSDNDYITNEPLFLHFSMRNPEYPSESKYELAKFVVALFYHPCDRGVETLKG